MAILANMVIFACAQNIFGTYFIEQISGRNAPIIRAIGDEKIDLVRENNGDNLISNSPLNSVD